MTTHEFQNDTTQEERKAVIKDTYLSRAEAEADELGGRFKQLTPRSITGTAPTPQYPKLPANSPWASTDPVSPAPPLGIDVYAGEPGGTEKEIQASLARNPVANYPAVATGSFLRRLK